MGLKKILGIALVGLLGFTVLGCNSEGDTPTGDNVGAFGSYEELREYLSDNLDSTDYYYNSWGLLESAEATDTTLDSVAYGEADSATDEDREYSETNSQVDGVTESDTILTDGYNIYIVSGRKFFIVDSDTLDINYTYEIEQGYLGEMYLYEDTLVLISQIYTYTEMICSYSDSFYEEGSDGDVTSGENIDSTYTYTCYDYSYGTQITLFDVSDTNNVSIKRELYFDSSYLIDSRMIDEQLYLILNNYMYNYGYEEADYIPKYIDTTVSSDFIQLPASSIYFMSNDGLSYSFLTLVSFDVTDNEAASVKAYLGSTWQVYMSLNNLYVISYNWEYNEEEGYYDYNTYVLRFAIEAGVLSYKAIGEIEGSPLNQFSMDEYDGVFRIATTGYSYDSESGWEIDNFLYTLDATTDNEMVQLATLSGLGKPGERIYAVRFDETIGYVVTFEQIDPLYVIDLEDPYNPLVIGELEEEGVSDYLHVITDDLLLGIGRQAETNGDWTWFTGVKVSLYDTTSDDPVNIDTYLVEGEYSYTNVIYDHKAFLSFTPSGADFTYVGIPVYEYYEDYSGFSQSLYLFKVYHSGDLELVTKLTHMEEDESGSYQYFDSIERAVIIDNYVYTVSYSSIRMFDMNSDFDLLEETELNPSYYSYWGYPEADEE